MKKRNKIISLLLLMALCLSLIGCGGSTEEEKEAVETPEYVYTARFEPISTDSDSYLQPRAFDEAGVYVSTYEKVGEEIPEGAVVEYEGQYDVYENRLYYLSFDGSKRMLEDYAPMKPAEGEGKEEFYSGSSLSNLFLEADGKLTAVEQVYAQWFEGPEGMSNEDPEYWNYMKYEDAYYIRKLNEDGSEISSARIQVPEGQYLNLWSAQIDGEGNLVTGADMSLMAIGADGSAVWTIEGRDGDYMESVVRFADGSVGATVWGENGMELLPVVNGAFGEAVAIPRDAYTLYPGSGDYDFYYTSGINFYGFRAETGESTRLFNWIDCDVNSNEMSSISVRPDGSVLGILNSYDQQNERYNNELVTISKQPYDAVPKKEMLTMAVLYMGYDTQEQIIDFNRRNEQYRIQVLDYSQYNTDEDYEAGLTKLTTEIMAGKMPDILIYNSEMPFTQLAAKGLLEDLYPFIDADPDMSREDFFPNVLGTLEVDGKLYATCAGFGINSLMGASSVVGGEPGWTYEELEAALAIMPEGCDPLDPYITRDQILRNCLALDMNSFVDWTSGQCNFDSDSFVALLEFANRFPAEYDWESDGGHMESTEERLKQGKQMLIQTYTYSPMDQAYNEVYFGGDATYIGWPTSSGTGNMLSLNEGYMMSSKCENKDAAWAFLRTFFTEEYQEDQYNLPTNRNVFEKQLEEAMTPQYQKDAEGNYLLNEEGERIPIVQMTWVNQDGQEFQFYALSQEQADELTELIETTTKRADYDNDMYEIVNEQAEAYFSGQKSAQEVARLIQSKANIYVNEQR